ncbi:MULTISPECIES: TonB-dependent receptor [unclassified Rubrivivax]|uniref:TonB-dependent receptor n=1 Tax=unclassified Rubrivivax TaxID=2649762 RepID=UPI001E5E6DE9|nr:MULTISPECIES: TonB-dependent receptor [unclassified Rubrivivax]MCC9597821.1 TonB-dependent receptor [Rubrivivax sp. JA1055]MCC9645922.1 TonB-dependent receptor [Rubrivivax sp. JA1029]
MSRIKNRGAASGAPRRRAVALAAHLALAAVLAGAAALPAHAQAGSAAAVQADVPPGPLAQALNRFALQAGVALVVDAGQIAGLTSPGLSGAVTVEEGFARLLEGSGWRIGRTAAGYVLLAAPAAAGGEAGTSLPAVRASASRIQDPDATPEAYGRQTARGGRVGVLGNQDFMDTPFSTVAYTSELIADQNAKTLADVLQNDPSVRFMTPAGHMTENLLLRGYLVTAENMVMNGLYGVAPYGHVPTEFVERVEILRGASGLVYGMSPDGAIGGVVSLTPKRAGEQPLARLTLDYEGRSQAGLHADVGRRFGSDGAFGVRFNGAWRDGGTAIEGQDKSRALGALALDYRSPRLRASFDVYDVHETTEDGSPMMASFATRVVKAPDSSTNLFRGTRSRMDNRGVALRVEGDVDDRLEVYAALGRRLTDYDGYINGTWAGSVAADGSFSGVTVEQDGYKASTSYDLGLRARLDTGSLRHELVFSVSGLNLESGMIYTRSASFASNIYAPGPVAIAADPGRSPKTGDTELRGIALVDTLSWLDERVALTLGLRRQEVRDTSYDARTGAVSADYVKHVTTPAVGLVVKPWSRQLALYANYIEGLSKGGSSPLTAANPNVVFEPYVSKQKEIGLKWDGGDFAHTLALYEITQPSMIADAANRYSVDGEKRVRGLEWTAMGQPWRGVRVLGGLSLADGKQVRTSKGVNDGHDAYGVPDWQANLGAEWDLPWLKGLVVGARVVHTDDQYLNSANTLRIPSWTRWDASLRYTTTIAGRATTWRGSVVNLLAKDYWAGPYHGEGFTTLSQPRTVSLSATVDF